MRETGTRQAPATLSEDLLDNYAEGWIERGRLAAARQAEWREAARNRLPALVSLLVERFEVTRITLFGSFARGSAVPGSDIDLLIHDRGSGDEREALVLWLDGWSKSLAEMNYLRTGYRSDGLLDVHYLTDEDIAKRTSFAVKIGAITDAARLLAENTAES